MADDVVYDFGNVNIIDPVYINEIQISKQRKLRTCVVPR